MRNYLSSWSSNSQFTKIDIINALIIIFLWIVMSILVNPLGDFPLNDDWVYGRAAQSIVKEGNFTLSGGNTSANLVAQAFWGALFCLPFGFSFSALRISTLTLGLIGVLASYGLLREARASRTISFIGAFLIEVNPIYFGLSNTFMTDVPFFAVATMSLYFLIQGLNHNRKVEIIFGILLSYLSILIRQNGIIIPVAFGFAYIFKNGISKSNIAMAIIPTLIGICLQLSYQSWLELTNRTSPNFNLQSRYLIEAIFSGNILPVIRGSIGNTLLALIYIGLFTFPLIIPMFATRFRTLPLRDRRVIVFAIPTLSISILMIIRLVKKDFIMPYKGNILTDFGLGPLTLHDTFFLKSSYSFTPTILKQFWIALTIIAVFSSVLLMYYLLITAKQLLQKPENIQSSNPKWMNILVILSILLYYLPIGAMGGGFDRYMLLLMPLLMVLVVSCDQKIIQLYPINKYMISIALAIILIYGGFTVGATHDYLSWNRIRWQALDGFLLHDLKVSPNKIDGGYEFNCWYLYNPNDTYANKFEVNPNKTDKSFWYVDRDDYMITFGSLPAYYELKRYQTGRWLPFGPKTISVLHKKNQCNIHRHSVLSAPDSITPRPTTGTP